MKKIIPLTLLAMGLSLNTYAEMTKIELSKYQGVISCVDRSFFDGGYTEGEPERLKIMNVLLEKVGLQSYEESLKQKKIKIDTDSYMEGYETCDNNWDFLKVEAKKVGIAPEDGW